MSWKKENTIGDILGTRILLWWSIGEHNSNQIQWLFHIDSSRGQETYLVGKSYLLGSLPPLEVFIDHWPFLTFETSWLLNATWEIHYSFEYRVRYLGACWILDLVKNRSRMDNFNFCQHSNLDLSVLGVQHYLKPAPILILKNATLSEIPC